MSLCLTNSFYTCLFDPQKSGDPCLTAYTLRYKNKKLIVSSVCMAYVIGQWTTILDDLAGMYRKKNPDVSIKPKHIMCTCCTCE